MNLSSPVDGFIGGNRPFTGKSLLIIIGGGIAAYKVLELIRRAKDRGFLVRVIMTRAAGEFVTPLAVSSLAGEKVFNDMFSLTDEADIGHIALSRSADLLVVAPATADLLAKMATGQADDLASTALLATDTPILVAPAMNPRMWSHVATQRNVETLRSDGIHFIGPNVGAMAERGESGLGRMAEPHEILAAIEALLSPSPLLISSDEGHDKQILSMPLAGKRVLVTSGPTHEPIDPVRYIANQSSGKQGHAIAQAAAEAGAEVILVSGPVNLPDPAGVSVRHVVTALEMQAVVQEHLPVDVAIFAAAVADWRVAEEAESKIKKGSEAAPQFMLVENPDILANVSKGTLRPQLVVGFAAETDNVIENAKSKLARKGCDWIIANDVSKNTNVMGGESNTVHLVKTDSIENWPLMGKTEVARRLIACISDFLKGKHL